jgi:hypothetical protein
LMPVPCRSLTEAAMVSTPAIGAATAAAGQPRPRDRVPPCATAHSPKGSYASETCRACKPRPQAPRPAERFDFRRRRGPFAMTTWHSPERVQSVSGARSDSQRRLTSIAQRPRVDAHATLTQACGRSGPAPAFTSGILECGDFSTDRSAPAFGQRLDRTAITRRPKRAR